MLVAVKVEVTIHYLVTGYGVFEGEKWTLCKLGETNRCSHTAGTVMREFRFFQVKFKSTWCLHKPQNISI